MTERIAKLLFVAGALSILTTAALGQTAKHPALPNNLTKYVDKYPVDLMKVPAVKSRLKALLGRRYSEFDESIGVQHMIEKKGEFLLASGCMPHLCINNAAAFVIDLKNKRVHAAIYEENAAPRYFNEDKAATPQVLLDWVAELKGS